MTLKAIRFGAALCVIAAVSAEGAAPPTVGSPPAVVGRCAFTTIRWVGQRLGDPETHRDVPDTGSSLTLVNGVMGVSYDQVPAVNRSRAGDPVMTCLARLPRHCPPGDRRGKWYATANLRTNEAWMLPDSEHQCGGA